MKKQASQTKKNVSQYLANMSYDCVCGGVELYNDALISLHRVTKIFGVRLISRPDNFISFYRLSELIFFFFFNRLTPDNVRHKIHIGQAQPFIMDIFQNNCLSVTLSGKLGVPMKLKGCPQPFPPPPPHTHPTIIKGVHMNIKMIPL